VFMCCYLVVIFVILFVGVLSLFSLSLLIVCYVSFCSFIYCYCCFIVDVLLCCHVLLLVCYSFHHVFFDLL